MTASVANNANCPELLASRLAKLLVTNTYDCAICCDTVRAHHAVWSDPNCYAIFHIGCIKTWIKSSTDHTLSIWRCPACQCSHNDSIETYLCWCQKQIRPEKSIILPHSCGQTCAKRRPSECSHSCMSVCHPGPCPPCSEIGPVQPCYCGRQSRQVRCVETDYKTNGFTCLGICQNPLRCGRHTCKEICHAGNCPACCCIVSVPCVCKQESRSISCDEVPSHGTTSSVYYEWHCDRPCGIMLECGAHQCSAVCHEHQPSLHDLCPYRPGQITKCHCGASTLESLNIVRSCCRDEIPSCGKTCQRSLACGHQCKAICHAGSCPPCTQQLTISCRCGSSTSLQSCHNAQTTSASICERICRSGMNCKRHICKRQCCEDLIYAQERSSRSNKSRNINHAHSSRAQLTAYEFEPHHICTKSCNKALSCGKHFCQSLCHMGSCPPCLEASFEDLTCRCGAAVIPAPVLCGTDRPSCRMPCVVRPPCGHPAVEHTCHPEELPCPRCPYLTQRSCNCGKRTLANQPCWRIDVQCGMPCNEVLACGIHRCRRSCHLPGQCEVACSQKCSRPLPSCGHPCSRPCHEGPCDTPMANCDVPVIVKCQCGHHIQRLTCSEASSTLCNEGPQNGWLPCVEACLKIQRRQVIADALGIVKASENLTDVVEYEPDTIQFYTSHRAWCDGIEETFQALCKKDTTSMMLKPMKYEFRAFVHELAQVWRLISESFDEEPKRSVQITKTSRSCPPFKSLSQAARRRTSKHLDNQVPAVKDSLKLTGRDYNAFLLSSFPVSMTADDLRAILCSENGAEPSFEVTTPDISNHFLIIPESYLVEISHVAHTEVLAAPSLQDSQHILERKLADIGTLEKCSINAAKQVLNREAADPYINVRRTRKGGNNQIAGKADILPKTNSFAALASHD